MNQGSSSRHSSYYCRIWYGDTVAILPSSRGNWPVTEIGIDVTGQGFTAFLVGMVAVGQLESSMSGEGLALALPLPFHFTFGPSSDELNDHSSALYLSGKGGGSLSSLTHLAGGGIPHRMFPGQRSDCQSVGGRWTVHFPLS